MPEDIQKSFHKLLDELDDRFTRAGMRIVEEMPRLVEGYLSGEPDIIEDARRLGVESSSECEGVEDQGFILMARHQPMGSDLRRLVAMLRMCVDVDRSAALLRHACESIRVSSPERLPESIRGQLRELGTTSAEVFAGGMEAWRTKDALAVNDLDEADERVDHLQRLLLETAGKDERTIAERLTLGLVARYFERIADHGVAIARDTAFTVTGERVVLPSSATPAS